ncbi:hypothetical protein ACGFIF_36705 [Kribbella sp. NPDC049174]
MRVFVAGATGVIGQRARYTLDWHPQYVSWRQGFAAELTPTSECR